MSEHVVTLKSEKSIKMLKGAKKEQVKIKHFCNNGFCGKCTVKVLEGKVSAPTNREIKKLGEDAIKQGYRLSCMAEFSGEVKFERVAK